MPIRRATAADAEAIAAIHVAAYDETYRGIAPPEVFEGLTLERRTASGGASSPSRRRMRWPSSSNRTARQPASVQTGSTGAEPPPSAGSRLFIC